MKKPFSWETLLEKSVRYHRMSRIMRLTICLLLIFTCFAFANHTYSQSARINLNKQNATLREVLEEIEKQTDYLFVSNWEIHLEQKVSIRVKNEQVINILNQLFSDTDLSYAMEGVNIILSKSTRPLITQQQERRITGTVKDENGEPIAGVNVTEKGADNKAITNVDGDFSMQVSDDAVLQLSYIGYAHVDVAVANKSHISVTLQADNQTLDEIVVVGYGTVKKRDLTGAVSSIKADQLLNDQPETLQDMLRSGTSGLSVGLSTDTKGNSSMLVRGKNSIQAGTSPLIVLDGVIYQGELTDINPNDIEQIDVLKDASSAAVYGAKSASGVVLITTKKGKGETPSINFGTTMGLSFKNNLTDVYGKDDFATYRKNLLESTNVNAKPYQFANPDDLPSEVSLADWMAYTGAGGDPQREWLQRLAFKDIEIRNYLAGNVIDWESKVFKNTALRQDYSVSASGKKKDFTYYTSANYIDNEDNVVGGGYSAVRARINLESNISDFITFGTNTQFTSRDESPVRVDWAGYQTNTPFGSTYEEDGTTYRLYPSDDNMAQNPLIDAYYTNRRQEINNLNSSIYLRFDLPLGLSVQTTYSPRYEWEQALEHRSSQHPLWAITNGFASRYQRKDLYWQWDNLLKWNKSFGKHAFDATFLANWENFQRWGNTIENKDFDPNDALGWGKIDAGLIPIISSNDEYRSGDALMGRLAYVYDSRYLMTLTVRRDGYSAFGQENPRATFPSMAVAWVFSEERFFNFDWMDYGKLRFSWGQNGNRDIGVYSALMDMSTRKYFYIDETGNYYDVNGFFSSRMANSSLQWETTTAINAGLDFSFLNGRLDGSIEVYRMKTTNLLNSRQLPDVIGYKSVTSNIGEIENSGFELSLQSLNMEVNDFRWRTSLNVSYNKNRINHLYGDMVDILDGNGNVVGQKEADDIANKRFIGYSLDEIWGLQVLGVWQQDEADEAANYGVRPGDFKLLDVNGDHKYTQEDYVFQGRTSPNLRWNMRNDFSFLKHFNFSFTLYSALGSYATYNRAKNAGDSMDRQNYFKIPYWTPENPTNEYARLNSGTGGANFDVYRNNSFVRLDNISFGYSVPSELSSRYRIEAMKLSATMKNVGSWAPHWKDGDPENASGANIPRILYLGLNLTF